MEKRIMLTEEDFKALVSGDIVTRGEVKIALQDIGYDLMIKIIVDKQCYGADELSASINKEIKESISGDHSEMLL